jgi:hypothetical protein
MEALKPLWLDFTLSHSQLDRRVHSLEADAMQNIINTGPRLPFSDSDPGGEKVAELLARVEFAENQIEGMSSRANVKGPNFGNTDFNTVGDALTWVKEDLSNGEFGHFMDSISIFCFHGNNSGRNAHAGACHE